MNLSAGKIFLWYQSVSGGATHKVEVLFEGGGLDGVKKAVDNWLKENGVPNYVSYVKVGFFDEVFINDNNPTDEIVIDNLHLKPNNRSYRRIGVWDWQKNEILYQCDVWFFGFVWLVEEIIWQDLKKKLANQ